MRLLFATLLIAVSISAASQTEITTKDYQLLIGPELDAKKSFTISEIIGHDESGYYVIRSKKAGLFGGMSFQKNSGRINEKARFYLEKYNYDLGLIESVDLDEILDQTGFDYHFMEFKARKLLLYISLYNSELKSRTLYVQEVSTKTLKPIKDPMMLYRNGNLRNGNFKGEFYASSISSNNRYQLFVIEKEIKEKNIRVFQLLAFDLSFNKLWENELTIPLSAKHVTIQNILIDDFNQAHVLIRIKNDQYGTFSQFKLYSVLQNGGESKELTLNIPEKHINNVQMASFNEAQLVCAGFYSNKGFYSVDGSFYCKVDFYEQQFLQVHFDEFDVEFITQYMKDRKAKRMKKKEKRGKEIEMPDYELDELIIYEDGSVLLLAEQFRVDVVTNYSYYGGTTTTYYYNYNDIIAIKFNPDGETSWATKIPKTQRSAGDEGFYSSYSMITNDDDLFFIYNDNMENFDFKDAKKIKNYVPYSSESATFISHINGDGEHSKEILLYNQQIDSVIKPTISHHLSKNELILYGHRGNHQNFIAVNLRKNQ